MKSVRTASAFVVASILVTGVAAAQEQPPPSAEADAAARAELTPPTVIPQATNPDQPAAAEPRYDLIRVNAGLKVGYVPSSGFDTFSSNNALPQFSIDATYPVLTQGKLVVGLGLGWDIGGRSDAIRAFESSLTTHRLYVPIEARYHFVPGVYGFGKVAPGAAAMMARVREGSSPNELSATGWAFSADASVGASILLGPRNKLEKRSIRFWATPEIGYAFTTKATLEANPGRADEDLLGADENTRLQGLALSGLFWRASVGATF